MATYPQDKPINYREVYFTHTTLRTINGNPTYADIQHIYKQVKANAASVPSTLGGGQHGHLGLTTNATTYTRIASTPYVRPTAPAPLGPNITGTAAQIAENRRTHNLAVASYHQANLIEKTILNQIQEALDDSVLMPLLHDDTGTIKSSIPEVFKYLFDTYGNITDQMIHEERATLLQHQYIHEQPVANIFSKIHKYATLAEAHGTPETDPQLISIGKIILSNARIFADAIEKWNDKPDTDKTWSNFKTHFTAAQINYKKARPTDTTGMHQYTNNTANIVQEVLQQLDTHPLYHTNNQTLTSTHTAATVTQQPSDISALITAVKDLQHSLHTNIGTNNHTQNNATTTQTQNRRPRNPYKNQKYCWTHGACNHTSKSCTQRAHGHKEEATFNNMFGGSTKRCFWLPST